MADNTNPTVIQPISVVAPLTSLNNINASAGSLSIKMPDGSTTSLETLPNGESVLITSKSQTYKDDKTQASQKTKTERMTGSDGSTSSMTTTVITDSTGKNKEYRTNSQWTNVDGTSSSTDTRKYTTTGYSNEETTTTDINKRGTKQNKTTVTTESTDENGSTTTTSSKINLYGNSFNIETKVNIKNVGTPFAPAQTYEEENVYKLNGREVTKEEYEKELARNQDSFNNGSVFGPGVSIIGMTDALGGKIELPTYIAPLDLKGIEANPTTVEETVKPDNTDNNDDFENNNDSLYKANNKYDSTISHNNLDQPYKVDAFEIPNWGINNFINERASWQKQLTIAGEPGWWYFKIFFKFKSDHGLLGGVLTPDNTAINTAHSYLQTMTEFNKGYYYRDSNLDNRLIALDKFVKSLSFISCEAPWFFSSVKGLDKANLMNFNKSLTEEKHIEITCLPDAVDMRLSTLFDLYAFACYDNTNQRIILPENMRMFDMSVVLFQTPIALYQTSISSNTEGKFDYKQLNSEDNRMSFKMFTFKNCEFDIESIAGTVPGDVNNEKPFQLGKNSIKIKYNRVYTHLSNEWMNLLFGTNGSLKENNDRQQNRRINAIKNAMQNMYYNPGEVQYKELIDASENIICDGMRFINNDYIHGNAWY